ncbi:alpha,alpha-phosphotrehalase [Sebaldella sp. S0638]|uniref:alpha,alpha-phosphotrehalase n=1 Tax=Sebaldella sp. S0638 TaxID=2957809 RepID=UPI0020A219E0|nr:alpha,alpha-phosphotrehalase [Sebaldella sp. S0638]MCP1223599.1 alpha,alpha-phosphotrehalase [Sebaldella sp. S0638]
MTDYKKMSVYQIYPKSFQDSNGDGTGDINGIISRLPYIADLGVEYIWLTPMYVSPGNDNGYDIADYYNIDPVYGTMDDFQNLLMEAHKRNLKVMMDIVVNHTSTEHMWFKESSKSEDNPYRDFYIWKKNTGKLPNNWVSKFGGPAWKLDERTDSYYLHLFDVTQADLNWEYEPMRQEIYKMMRYWMDLGIDGFRLDVINLLSKEQNFPDDTLDTFTDDGRKYYTDGPKIHEYLREMNREVFSRYDNVITVGEMSSTTLEACIEYTKPENKELSMIFSFHHLKTDYKNKDKWELQKSDIKELKEYFTKWQNGMEKENEWLALFWCNHDQPRIVSRMGNENVYRYESAAMLATLIHMMQGTPYIYQGEEIGMLNAHFDNIADYEDVESLNAYENMLNAGKTAEEALEVLRERSRDNARTPVQWDNTENSGFTTGKPWIKMGKMADGINVEEDLKSEKSVFSYYKKLIKLRKEYDIIRDGNFTILDEDSEDTFIYKRETDGEILYVICNLTDKAAGINRGIMNSAESGECLIANMKIPCENSMLKPYETCVWLVKK